MSTPCPKCGHVEADAANFCSVCGTPLDHPDDATSTMQHPVLDLDEDSATVPPGSDDALLVVTRGPNAGSRFVVGEGTTTLGRHPDSDIFLDDVTVSRSHAEVSGAEGTWTIRDVGSLNGTYVNRDRVDEAVLTNGDEVQIGRFKLVFFPGRWGELVPGGKDHWSISEVLEELQEDFDDDAISISKIRFLETKGLIRPDRTPSGYRKFSRDDVDLLRWILVQQRDNFLPLKVIRQRIEDGAHQRPDDELAIDSPVVDDSPEPAPTPPEVPTPEVRTSNVAGLVEAPGPSNPPSRPRSRSPRPAPTAVIEPDVDRGTGRTRSEVAAAVGLTVAQLQELERYDVIEQAKGSGETTYDTAAEAAAALAAAFLHRGFEARHLKPIVNAARAQADLLEQYLRPQLAQRDVAARREAAASVEELVEVGAGLQAGLVRRRLRRLLD